MVTVPVTKSKGVSIQSSTNEDISDTILKPFQPIERLEELGINVTDINKLKAAGICTVLGVIQTTKKDLCNIKGLTELKVDKISDCASKLEVTNSFISASELYKIRKSILKINTGSEMLNRLLNGGIETMSITELFGENRTGKTQICHTISVTSQIINPTEPFKVCYIDTENTFRPEKIEKICERFDLDPMITLDNILYSKAYTNEHLLQLISNITSKMVEERFVLLIIDSIMSLFRVDYSGRGELAERQQRLNKLLSNLLKIAQQFNVAIVLTNHVISEPSGALSFISNPIKPAGGNVIGHASTCRLSLRKGKGNQRICKVYDSPNLPESECIFELSDSGIIDVTE
ncbi:meiotic recombinase Dmc1 [Theileria parva strain Muguga]|uniref:Meiotic recombination protein DMC1, putative n=1 Tax=Theileria parva TaxID=5875 RepID=Q4N317_THEPA|nr:meiotic recombinase Dmc1 [Theileria parva strain Muguga]EAN31522.1 meiotic recombinase Dmc1 [Theileria parva strain Muguga]|eukprot:XP_763805.1 meiotic recombination protein DMC1 [Theileria parva strain Muguga]